VGLGLAGLLLLAFYLWLLRTQERRAGAARRRPLGGKFESGHPGSDHS